MSSNIRSARLNRYVWSSVLSCAIASVAAAAAEEAASVPASASRDTTQYGRNTDNNVLEEVIVTAERRQADLQGTAASITVRTGEELASQGRYTTRQILEDVPGVVAVNNSSLNVGSADVQGNNITIRGITPGESASGGPSGISASPGTAVYVDGVYEGVGGNYDLDRVEVLRGPQGTLYGRSATTGVVAFRTRNPSMDGISGNGGVEVGDYSLQHYTGALNMPIGKTLAARVSGDYYDQGQGYYGQGNQGMAKRTNGRAKVLWEPNENFSLLVGLAYEKNQAFSGGNSTTAATPTLALRTLTGPILPSQKLQHQYWAEANWDLGPVTLTYLPAYRTWEQEDFLLTDANFFGMGYPLKQRFLTPQDKFLTQEFRIASNDSKVQWQAGLFQYHNELRNSNHNYLSNPDGSEYVVQTDTTDHKETKSFGVFAEATAPLSDALRLTLGVRYDKTEVTTSESFYDNVFSLCGTPLQGLLPPFPPGISCTGPSRANVPSPPAASINDFKVKFNAFNYKARLEYDVTAKSMIYGMLSTGYRPGDAGIASRQVNVVDAEKLTSFEVGSKNRFLDDSLQLNVGLYYYSYKGFRTTYIPNTPSPVDFTNFRNQLRVSVPATNIGGELELLYRVTPHDRVGLNYNHVQSKWKDKPAAFAAAQPESKRAITPTSVNANYEHVFDLPGGSILSARIDGRYEASHLTQNLHADWLAIGYGQYVSVGSRSVGNLSLAWANEGGKYSVSAYVRNFTDRKYTTYTVGGNPINLPVRWTDPRTYGAMVSVRF